MGVKQHTEETKAKIAAAKRGRPLSAEHRAKISAGNKGKAVSAETRAKLSASLRVSPKARAHNDRLSVLKSGRPTSDAHKAALRSSAAFQAASAAAREKAHAARRGAKLSPEHLAIVRANNLGRTFGPEARQRMSEAAKRRGPRTDAHRQAMSVAMKASDKAASQRSRLYLANPSSIERIVHAVLDAMGVAFQPQHRVGRYIADVFVPSHQLIVECDGSYWHRDRAQQDAARDDYMRARGLSVLRLSETDIRAGRSSDQIARCLVLAKSG